MPSTSAAILPKVVFPLPESPVNTMFSISTPPFVPLSARKQKGELIFMNSPKIDHCCFRIMLKNKAHDNILLFQSQKSRSHKRPS